MGIESIVSLIVVGAIAGWLAGLIMQGRGFGIVGNIAVGIVGALIGTFALGQLGIVIGGTWVSAIVNSVIGAVILLFIIGLVKKA